MLNNYTISFDLILGNMKAMRFVLVCHYLIAAAFVVHANDTDANSTNAHRALQNDPRFDARISQLLAKNVLQLSQEIGTTILQDSDRSTEVISPLSIYMALSVLLMGSNGQTFNELMNLLKISNGKQCLTLYSILFSHLIITNLKSFFHIQI